MTFNILLPFEETFFIQQNETLAQSDALHVDVFFITVNLLQFEYCTRYEFSIFLPHGCLFTGLIGTFSNVINKSLYKAINSLGSQ